MEAHRHLTLKREVPDHRDHRYQPRRTAELPKKVDLRPGPWPVYQQGHLDSCTANVLAGAAELMQIRDEYPNPFAPSRLFLYYNERGLEHEVAENAPVYMRDAFKAVKRYGLCPEWMWPYVEAKFVLRPPIRCYRFAQHHRSIRYRRVSQDLDHMRSCVAQGHPFTLGITLYPGFPLPDWLAKLVGVRTSSTNVRTGSIPMPRSRKRALGNHALLVVGYDDPKRRFVIRNSWGSSWGVEGYGSLPYDYATDPTLSDSLWMMHSVS